MPIVPYDREAAVAYAKRWALSRNPKYYDYERLGGDCTNFASQCVYAGSQAMNYTPTYGWYYISANNKAPAWTGVEFFFRFMVNNAGTGPFMQTVPVARIEPGDVVQLKFAGDRYGHTPVVIAVGNPPDPGNILVATHTYDSLGRPLNTYFYEEIRYLHVLGVRK